MREIVHLQTGQVSPCSHLAASPDADHGLALLQCGNQIGGLLTLDWFLLAFSPSSVIQFRPMDHSDLRLKVQNSGKLFQTSMASKEMASKFFHVSFIRVVVELWQTGTRVPTIFS